MSDKVFEDEFMDLQSGLISLCLEVVDGKADKVFAYCSNEKYSKYFSAFFEADGELRELHQMNVPSDLIFRFLGAGTDELMGLDALCEKHKKPIPTEMKLFYDVKSGEFHADYKYKDVRKRKCAGQIFDEWVEEMRRIKGNYERKRRWFKK